MLNKLLCLCCLLGCTTTLHAQSISTSSNRIFLDISTHFSIVNNSYTDTWEPRPGFHLNLRTPFYAGQIEVGLRYSRFDGPVFSEVDSDFQSIFLHLGWSYPIRLASWYHITPGFRFGNNFMLFDEARTYTNESDTESFTVDTSESEFAYELVLRNQFKIANRWFLHANLSYNHTMTHFPLPVTFFTVGVTYSFPQPTWLKNIIR